MTGHKGANFQVLFATLLGSRVSSFTRKCACPAQDVLLYRSFHFVLDCPCAWAAASHDQASYNGARENGFYGLLLPSC